MLRMLHYLPAKRNGARAPLTLGADSVAPRNRPEAAPARRAAVECVGVDLFGFGSLLEHPLLEPLEETLTTRQPLACVLAVRSAKPVAHADTLIPVDNLLEFNPDLLCLFVREVLPERLEFNFFLEIHLAVLDNFLEVLGRLLPELRNQLLSFFCGQASQGQEMKAAA